MKTSRFVAFMIAILLCCVQAAGGLAAIIPAQGEGQIGYSAVVLCESLSVHTDRNGSSKVVRSLPYGTMLAVNDMWDGWGRCYLSETEGSAGWVRSDYLMVNPAYYVCDEATTVYAWDDIMAPKIALLKKGTKLPILRDGGEWLTVSLRAAAGCIHKTVADATDAAVVERVKSIGPIWKAVLKTPKGEYTLTDTEKLQWIQQHFSAAQLIASTGCPFDATLTLRLKDGTAITLSLATDSCSVFRTADGTCFTYKDTAKTRSLDDSASDAARVFWALFGLDIDALY